MAACATCGHFCNSYTLTTVNGETVVSDKVAGDTRAMTLRFNGDDIAISSEDGVNEWQDENPEHYK